MSYQTTVLADAPLFYNRAGTVDIGSLGLTGTIHGTVATGQTGLLPSGDPQTSDLFNGSTGYITASDAGLPTGANAWSHEIWIKPTGTNNNTTYFAFGTATSNEIEMLFFEATPNNYIAAGGWNSANEQDSTVLPVNGTIYYVLATYDGTNLRIYVGDTSTNILTAFVPKVLTLNITPTGTLYIGKDPIGDFYSGYAQERAIYGTALSATRVTAHWNIGAGLGGTTIEKTFSRRRRNR